ncbi:MAG: pantetheine-phosphate adenylyltransferase [Alphaproteobacteria bacterium]|nr:MAG: pantetheine-phosphate adenylyltransferase [Alphaproteobacteria bacterium]
MQTTSIGVYPGTFDPITKGHMDIITRALRVVDELVVAVALDTGKQPIFSLDERAALVCEDVRTYLGDNARRVRVCSFSGLLANFAQEQGAHVLIRGLRAVSDFEYEFQMACVNSKLAPHIETIFLTASESTHFVSSRFVKQIARLGASVEAFVSPNVSDALKAHFSS